MFVESAVLICIRICMYIIDEFINPNVPNWHFHELRETHQCVPKLLVDYIYIYIYIERERERERGKRESEKKPFTF